MIVLFSRYKIEADDADAFEKFNVSLLDEAAARYERPPRRGAPRQWRARFGLEFVWKVEDLRSRRKCSIAEAISVLTAKERARASRTGSPLPAWVEQPKRTLEVRFQEAQKFWRFRLRNMIEVLEKLDEHRARYPLAFPLRKFL